LRKHNSETTGITDLKLEYSLCPCGVVYRASIQLNGAQRSADIITQCTA